MKIGDYVRTKSGGIGKIIAIDTNASISHIITDNETFGLGWDGEQVNWDFRSEIVKSSPNIIDLIEVGDYVNGECVSCITKNNYIEIGYGEELYGLHNEDIKSIVTKEQFESMEYKVVE